MVDYQLLGLSLMFVSDFDSPQVWYRGAGSGDSHRGAKSIQPREPGQPTWKEGVTGDLRSVAF
jgi:hypothetical protein